MVTLKLEVVAYESNDKKMDSVYSKRVKAGKRRTYFFDIRATKGNDYFLTITESRKRFNDDGYDRHKIFLYKEDFNKFVKGLEDAVDYVKTELMPDFDFDAFNHEDYEEEPQIHPVRQEVMAETATKETELVAPEQPIETISQAQDETSEVKEVEADAPVKASASGDEQVDRW